ncbi:hypothetical protein [Streptomyces cellostaticus]|uniref:hypothetical protein n=1 Tax=Streptomyces cellostaticus TaxID=67285 RepID=UPI00295F1473|nr:hypothetical protein [Streptomyces cellostaticus]
MTVGIIHAFLQWVLGVFAPSTGRRRATARPIRPVPADQPEAPRTASPGLPAHRSPYGRDLPLDGRATAMVRPYVLLAMDFGINLDRHVIGAAGPAR